MSDQNVDYRDISKKGLWTNNPALVQLLGLCPLLAVTGSVVNALGLGLATMLVLLGSNISVSLIRHAVSDAVRLPAFVMIIASFTTATELLMQAFTYELYQVLGIFIPLIVTNCTILGRADAFASKHGVLASSIDAIMMGLGFLIVLLLLGASRELLGAGTLMAGMDLLLGPIASHWEIQLFGPDYPGLLVALLPPGAFIVTGFIIAAKNAIDYRQQQKAKAQSEAGRAPSRRVRTTGHIS